MCLNKKPNKSEQINQQTHTPRRPIYLTLCKINVLHFIYILIILHFWLFIQKRFQIKKIAKIEPNGVSNRRACLNCASKCSLCNTGPLQVRRSGGCRGPGVVAAGQGPRTMPSKASPQPPLARQAHSRYPARQAHSCYPARQAVDVQPWMHLIPLFCDGCDSTYTRRVVPLLACRSPPVVCFNRHQHRRVS